MIITVADEDGVFHVVIKDDMTIYTAMEQQKQLLEYLKPDHELHIDLSAVSEIDCAGLQLLLWLKQESTNLHLMHHSQAVIEVLELLNLSSHFGDPMVLSDNWKTS